LKIKDNVKQKQHRFYMVFVTFWSENKNLPSAMVKQNIFIENYYDD